MRLILTRVSHVHNRKMQIYNLRDLNLALPANKNIVILAVHTRSAEAMLEIICGIKAPTRGHIQRYGSISAPLGNDEYFHRELTGEQNLRLIAQVYGQNPNDLVNKVSTFTGLKEELKQKAQEYPGPMKRKITLSASVLMELDCYTVNGDMPEHPKKTFNNKIRRRFQHLSKHAQVILSNSTPAQIRLYAQCAVVIDASGYANFHDNVETGIEALEQLKQDTDTHAVE